MLLACVWVLLVLVVFVLGWFLSSGEIWFQSYTISSCWPTMSRTCPAMQEKKTQSVTGIVVKQQTPKKLGVVQSDFWKMREALLFAIWFFLCSMQVGGKTLTQPRLSNIIPCSECINSVLCHQRPENTTFLSFHFGCSCSHIYVDKLGVCDAWRHTFYAIGTFLLSSVCWMRTLVTGICPILLCAEFLPSSRPTLEWSSRYWLTRRPPLSVQLS